MVKFAVQVRGRIQSLMCLFVPGSKAVSAVV